MVEKSGFSAHVGQLSGKRRRCKADFSAVGFPRMSMKWDIRLVRWLNSRVVRGEIGFWVGSGFINAGTGAA